MRNSQSRLPGMLEVTLAMSLAMLGVVAPAVGQVAPDPVVEQRPVRFDGHAVVRVEIDTIRKLTTMMVLSPDCWSESVGLATLDFRIPPDRMSALEESGIPFEVLIPDVQKLIDEETRWHEDHRWLPGAGTGTLAGGADFFDDFRRVEEIDAWFEQLLGAYPDLITRSQAGTSIEGRPIWAYQITAPVDLEKRGVCINGMAHSREWVSPMTVCWLARSLLEGYGSDPEITPLMQELRWHLIPVLNPDGYAYSWDQNRLWRKNRRNNGDGTFGVDCNRNFDANFGGPGSSGNTASDIYRGTSAFSEPETQALRDYILARPEIAAHVDVHCYSQLMLYPYGYQESIPPGSEGLLHAELAIDLVQAIESYEGSIYIPEPAHSLYVASGAADDWSYDAANTISYTPELRDTGQFGFILPAVQIVPTGIEMLRAFKVLGETVRRRVFVSLPGGWPETVEVDEAAQVSVDIAPTWNRNASITAVSLLTPGETIQLSTFGEGRWVGALPALACGESIESRLRIQDSSGASFVWPREGGLNTTAASTSVLVEDDLETDGGWQVTNGAGLTAGGWQRAVPSADAISVSDCSAPASDDDGSGTCWLTGNGPSEFACQFDVDGGTTLLTSPRYPVGDGSASIGFSWWYDNTSGNNTEYDDVFVVELSGDDGATWSPLFSRSNGDSAQTGWSREQFPIADYVGDTDGVRLRFLCSDNDPGSVVEAAVDRVRVVTSGCPGGLPGDLDGDGSVSGADIAILLAVWGPCTGCPEDLNGDGIVGGADIAILLASWTG